MEKDLLVIIPCYNEADNIGRLLQALAATEPPAGWTIRWLVVNDCSKDATAAIVTGLGSPLLDLPVNLGIGGAMQSGFKYALRNGYSHAVQMDGDGQHPPAELYKLLQAADESGANVVIGSRYLEKQGFQSTRVRRWGIRYFRWLNRLLTGKSILDSTSGFRLLDRQALQLAALYYPDDYPEPESLVFFAKKGLSVVETPVHMKEREGGISSISGMDALFYCVKVTIAMFFSFARKI